MLESMTGAINIQEKKGSHVIAISLKSVNARGLDFSWRSSTGLEQQMEDELRAHFLRGRLEGEISVSGPLAVSISKPQLDAYRRALARAGLPLDELSSLAALKLPGVLEIMASSFNARDFSRSARKAVLALKKSRQKEGRAIVSIFKRKLQELKKLHGSLLQRFKFLSRTEVRRLERLWASNSDETQLARVEFESWFERQNIAEELERVKMHIKAVRKLLAGKAPAGRELDFYFQEFLRELSTSGAKVKDFHLRKVLIAMKTIVDEMKEQARNLC